MMITNLDVMDTVEGVENYTDYVRDVITETNRMVREHYEFALAELNVSSQLLLENSSLLIVTEAPTTEPVVQQTSAGDANTAGKKKEGIFASIMKLMRRIYGFFLDKLDRIVTNNDEWLAKNSGAFENMNLSDISVSITPFWEVDLAPIITSTVNKVSTLLGNATILNNEEYKDKQALFNAQFKAYLDVDGSLVTGAKNYFRTGSPDSKSIAPKTVQGNELKKIITSNMIPYCTNYKTTTKNAIQGAVTKATNAVNAADKKAVAESFNYILESAQVSILFEEKSNVVQFKPRGGGEQAAQNRPANPEVANNSSEADKHTPTTVAVKNTETGEAPKAGGETKDVVAKHLANGLQIIVAALMTAAEERYTAYIKTLRQIHSARGRKDDETKRDNERASRKAKK